MAIAALVSGCASKPLLPYSADTRPLVLAPIAQSGVEDERGRFREIYCAVLQAHGHDLPDYRDCDLALTRVGIEPAGSGRAVDLGPSRRRLVAAVVPGIGYDCVAQWLAPARSVADHVRNYGYDQIVIRVDALSGTARNARQIRDAIMAMDVGTGASRLVLIAPGVVQGGPPRIVRFKSTMIDLPILEYRPYRAFAMNKSSSVVFQIFTDADVPSGGSIDSPPGAPVPSLQTVWSVGLRLVFDWRHYYWWRGALSAGTPPNSGSLLEDLAGIRKIQSRNLH